MPRGPFKKDVRNQKEGEDHNFQQKMPMVKTFGPQVLVRYTDGNIMEDSYFVVSIFPVFPNLRVQICFF